MIETMFKAHEENIFRGLTLAYYEKFQENNAMMTMKFKKTEYDNEVGFKEGPNAKFEILERYKLLIIKKGKEKFFESKIDNVHENVHENMKKSKGANAFTIVCSEEEMCCIVKKNNCQILHACRTRTLNQKKEECF